LTTPLMMVQGAPRSLRCGRAGVGSGLREIGEHFCLPASRVWRERIGYLLVPVTTRRANRVLLFRARVTIATTIRNPAVVLDERFDEA
jgi:hypothetical protein